MTDRRRTDDPILEPIIARLAEAADTIRRLPGGGAGHTPLRAAWPAFVRDAADAYGWDDATARPAPPTAAAIDRLDETLGWIAAVPPPGGRLLWLRANRVGWKSICECLHCSRDTAWRKWRGALVELAATIAAGKAPQSRRRESWVASEVGVAVGVAAILAARITDAL